VEIVTLSEALRVGEVEATPREQDASGFLCETAIEGGGVAMKEMADMARTPAFEHVVFDTAAEQNFLPHHRRLKPSVSTALAQSDVEKYANSLWQQMTDAYPTCWRTRC
jgi:hypothetical protein